MIKSLKLFAACVDSMRMAEKEYLVRPTPTNKKIMEDLQSKVDAWVTWIHNQEDAELAKSVPPFINNPRSSYKSPNHNITQQLLTNHTPEEIERFFSPCKAYETETRRINQSKYKSWDIILYPKCLSQTLQTASYV